MLWVRDAAWLLALRFIQAVGVCAAAVTWQALVTDYYPPRALTAYSPTIMPLVGLSPALAPLLGSWILRAFRLAGYFRHALCYYAGPDAACFRAKPAHKKRRIRTQSPSPLPLYCGRKPIAVTC